jgi:hypothetical protein
VARGGAVFEYCAVAVSRNGDRVAAVSSVADAKLSVWDVPDVSGDPDDPPEVNRHGPNLRERGHLPSSLLLVDRSALFLLFLTGL